MISLICSSLTSKVSLADDDNAGEFHLIHHQFEDGANDVALALVVGLKTPKVVVEVRGTE